VLQPLDLSFDFTLPYTDFFVIYFIYLVIFSLQTCWDMEVCSSHLVIDFTLPYANLLIIILYLFIFSPDMSSNSPENSHMAVCNSHLVIDFTLPYTNFLIIIL
jgi:hypothetical protein